MSALRGKAVPPSAPPAGAPPVPSDSGASDDLSMAEQVFHESMDAFSAGDMDWKTAVEDLAASLMAMSPKPGAAKPPVPEAKPAVPPAGANPAA